MLTISAALMGAAPAALADPDPLVGDGVKWRPLTSQARMKAPPVTNARAWILVDADTGAVLASLRSRTPQLPASTLKTLTAVTLLPRLDLTQVYTARANDVGVEGSGAGLVLGGTYTVEQLFLGMLLPSGNDAATALTHIYNRDGRKAIALMNETARRLGATNTVVRNPTGLPIPGQHTTAADMAIIGRAAISSAAFRRLAQTKTVEFPGRMPKTGKPRKTYQLQNENPFIKHGVVGTLGGKTGYTRAALRTYWVAQQKNGRKLLVVMLGFTGSTKKMAQALLNWGFTQGSAVGAVAMLPPVRNVLATATPTPNPEQNSPRTALASKQSPDSTDVPRSATTVLLLALPAMVLTRRALRIRKTLISTSSTPSPRRG